MEIAKKIRRGTRVILQNVVKVMAVFSWSRWVLNAVYLKLTPSQRAFFYQKFAKLFREGRLRGSDGSWKVFVGNRCRLMPLTAENFWQEWDCALTILGHDLEIKQTYEALIASPEKPELFVDIGANYGTHSLLFLFNDIKTITFEPNSSCHNYFRRTSQLNHVTPQLEPVALGDRAGRVKLSYPKRDTWFGSTNNEDINKLGQFQDLVTEQVEQKTLDDYFPTIGRKRTLIKIDTEGNELSVLRGAIKTLQECRPMIIFECWEDNGQTKLFYNLFDFFNSQNYSIYHLPWNPTEKAEALTASQFADGSTSNFIAIPTVRPAS
jgi:FkbM family methyltransferase